MKMGGKKGKKEAVWIGERESEQERETQRNPSHL